MKIHYLQHVPFEELGAIADWCVARGHAATATQLYRESLPAEVDGDLLVVLGGPMNVYETKQHPWLTAEKHFLHKAIARGGRVLGICLGAQLLADVLGASVTRNAVTEIGWYPVELTPAASDVPGFDRLPQRFTALHWHGDTFAISQGALRLAYSEACPNQAFSWDGGRVLGLQFHLEETYDSLALLAQHAAADLSPAGQRTGSDAHWVASAGELLCTDAPFAHCKDLLFTLLDTWTAGSPVSCS